MDLKHLTDECLLDHTLKLVRHEREILTQVCHHLYEIERRRLFGKYPSLYEYAIGALNYSGDQAFRRIAAMRMMKQLPEIEAQLDSGQINLAHVGMAQALFNREDQAGTPLSVDKKRDLFESMAGQSTRQARRTVQNLSTTPLKYDDSIKALGDDRNLVTAEFSDALVAKIDKFRCLLAHQIPHAKLNDLLDRAMDVALADANPAKVPKRRTRPNSRAAIRRQIWLRDRGVCSKCGSNHALQEDHRVPESMDGQYTLENMRLLCRACNQREAIEKLGLGKMTPFLTRDHPRRRG